MNGPRRSTADSVGGSVNPPDESDIYTWTCPICDTSRTSYSASGRALHQALRALRAHVSTAAGAGHGERNSYPDTFDRERLVDQVVVHERDG